MRLWFKNVSFMCKEPVKVDLLIDMCMKMVREKTATLPGLPTN